MLLEVIETLPSGVAAAGWIPFAIVVAFSMLFSALYVRYFWNVHESDRFSAVTATLGICVALLTAFLLPVDAFLISYMKTENGTFKEWATNNTRVEVENSLLYTYYVLYGIIIFFMFFLLPLVYFTYEEKDDDVENNMSQRLCVALKCTSVFLLFAVALLLLGAFLPFRSAGLPSNATDTSEWEKIEYILKKLYYNRGVDAITFVLNVVTFIGMMILILYTGSGLSSFPIGLIRGFRGIKADQAYVEKRKSEIETRLALLRNREQLRKLTASDAAALAELEEEQRLVTRMEAELQHAQKGCLYKLRMLFGFSDIVFGILSILFGFLLWVSLCISNVDKLMHSYGHDLGYFLKEPYFLNPLDYIMVLAQKAFPVDYILFFGIVIFLVLCTISGVRSLGIWCFCVRMYKIRAHRTQPQGLIMLCAILMYGVLAQNVLLHAVIPQYTTYGSQRYQVVNETLGTVDLKPCSIMAPEGDCVMTRASYLMLRFAYKTWFFGAAFYWLMWTFLSAAVVGFFVSIIRSKKSFLDEAIDKDDFDESDEPLIST